MRLKGKIRNFSRDWINNKPIVELSLEEGNFNEIMALQNQDLSIELKKYREKRSLDANAYAWVLMQKIAEKIHSTKDDVYLMMLQRYSRSFTHIIVKENAIDKVKELYRTTIDLGEITIGNTTGHQLQVYFGSSTFNTKEMSVFIDGLVSECKELDIETLRPDELERMREEWKQFCNQ